MKVTRGTERHPGIIQGSQSLGHTLLTEYSYFKGTCTKSKARLLFSPGDRKMGVWEGNNCAQCLSPVSGQTKSWEWHGQRHHLCPSSLPRTVMLKQAESGNWWFKLSVHTTQHWEYLTSNLNSLFVFTFLSAQLNLIPSPMEAVKMSSVMPLECSEKVMNNTRIMEHLSFLDELYSTRAESVQCWLCTSSAFTLFKENIISKKQWSAANETGLGMALWIYVFHPLWNSKRANGLYNQHWTALQIFMA